MMKGELFSLDSKIRDVIQDEAFSGFGRLLFPVDLALPPQMTLKDLGKAFLWYSYIKPERTVSLVNELKERVLAGETVFYDIYSPAEKAADPKRRIRGYFSSAASLRARRPFSVPAAGLSMSVPCMTVFLMPRSLPRTVTTPLPSSIASVPKRPVKICPGPLPLSMTMQEN